jgi:hypothetical protein
MTFRVDVLTLFPEAVTDYARTSVLGRALTSGVWQLYVHDIRDAVDDPHRTVDDTPFGGGAGMVMQAEPILRTIEATPTLARPVIALTPSGRTFSHAVAKELSALDGFTLLCGRYEGFDQRAASSPLCALLSRWCDYAPVPSATTSRAPMNRSATGCSSIPTTPSRRSFADAPCQRFCDRATTHASRAGGERRPYGARWRAVPT